MKELKTYRDVFQAFLDGHEIEYWGEHSNAWLPSTCAWNFISGNLDKEIGTRKYRIKPSKPSKPSIDWSQVNDEYRYLSKSSGDNLYLHKTKPVLSNRFWLGTEVDDRSTVLANTFKSCALGDCDWTESLVERPKE